MSLRDYKQKRHFDRTPEPKGKVRTKTGRQFVVQKHAARNLHYDFRLELDGVLKSWAVPKGPSLDPAVKRLAMQVEDHPVEYGAFEGIIPQGEYGGGTVMLWDRGEWEPIGDPHDSFRTGKIKFRLHGKKLGGAWMLVRTGDKLSGKDQRRWLLFKERDDYAVSADKEDVLTEHPRSVTTGRGLDEIADDRDRVWGGKESSNGKRVRSKNASANEYDKRTQKFAGVRLTSPSKVLYPELGITKLELANYYRSIADWMLPHIVDRPIVLVRCPEGCDKECFYQKHPGAGAPDVLRQISIREKSNSNHYLVVDDAAGLISLAQLAALEIHAWGARADRLEYPDRLVFDLDPDPSVEWASVVQGARQTREFLQELGLESFVKTTGGKGLHLVVPIDRRHNWNEAKAFCKQVADLIALADGAHYTAQMAKARRTGKIFIDYMRNGRGATAIVPYSPRARHGAPVSTPLTWRELSPRIRSDHYTVRNLGRRLQSLRRDPWEGFSAIRQTLTGPLKKLRSLTETQRNGSK